MKLMFLENKGEMNGGGFINKLLHLNKPEQNFQNFVKEISGFGGKRNNKNTKFKYIQASKSKSIIEKK
jgi:hypothetical protein|tara:strand:+ start:368 stop:571 length:204 start_codon:yes stop_codon:yes gene_type:complete